MKAKPILSTFGKGTAGSVALNFASSGGANCDPRCQLHPDSDSDVSGKCYAAVVEKRGDRVELFNKLLRHESTPPALLIGQAMVELQALVNSGNRPPWFRLSTAGSLPQPDDASPLFIRQLRALLNYCNRESIPVHCPVETHSKARFYRAQVGDLVVIRESLQVSGSHRKTLGAVSFVGGADIVEGKAIRKRRIDASAAVAKQRYKKTGRKTIVCPAVKSSFTHRGDKEHNAKNKCGNCTACANPLIDIVYPLH
jgi:hypothetical protein